MSPLLILVCSGVAVQNALPPPHQNQTKVENLARGLEQHIYESAESRVSCLYQYLALLWLMPFAPSLAVGGLFVQATIHIFALTNQFTFLGKLYGKDKRSANKHRAKRYCLHEFHPLLTLTRIFE